VPLQRHIFGALAEFERERIIERVPAGLRHARARGVKLGRKPYAIPDERFEAIADLPLRKAAAQLGVSKGAVQRWRASGNRSCESATLASEQAAF